MDLAEVHQELVDDIRYMLEQVGEAPNVKSIDVILETLSDEFEALALCHLLEFADTLQFRENLARSAHARRFFLRRSASEGDTDNRHLAKSRTRAFFAALSAGALGLAREIAWLSIHPWRANWEYEDDHAYASALHALVKAHDPANPDATLALDEMRASVERFERVIGDEVSKRYAVVQSILVRDQAAFSDALVALMEAETLRIEADRESAAVHERDFLYWPNARISIEGLALIKAGELVTLVAPKDLPLCPPLARLPWSTHTFRDLFQEIEALV